MYINIPIMLAIMVPVFLLWPSFTLPSQLPVSRSLAQMDWVGVTLHISSGVLFVVAALFSGSIWGFSSASSIVIWVVWGITFLTYIAQQKFCWFTTRERRIFPGELIPHRLIGLAALATCCGAGGYAVTLYYIPLFFAFTQGLGPIDCAVRMLPFVGVFIVSALMSGALLPRVRRYKAFYVLAGALDLTGSALLATITSTTSTSRVLGYEAVLGFGIGLTWFHGVSLSNVAVQTPAERFAAAALMNMSQLGPISIGLAIAASVFQNYGFNQLKSALGDSGFDDLAIREALAGLKSPIWASGNIDLQELAVAAIVGVIAKLFYISLAGGVVYFIAACCMKWEALTFKENPQVEGESKA